MLDWERIDTVLLDMDGTVLDLRFDNHFWGEVLPERYAALHGVPRAQADAAFADYIARNRGHLDYYCIDAWSRFTGLPVREMQDECAHLLCFRPQGDTLLDRLREAGKDVRIVTNAHGDSVALKQRRLAIRDRVPQFHSTHDFGHPKESQLFWQAFARAHPFDPARTLFVDDTEHVLDSARAYGIAWTLCVTTPDSALPAHVPERHAGIADFAPLLASLPSNDPLAVAP